MQALCIYHKADLDGVCSAAIVKHFVPDVELYGMEYGEPFPWDETLPSVLAIFPFAQTPEGSPCVNPEWKDAPGRVLIVDDKGERIEEPKAVFDRLPRFELRSVNRRAVYMVDFSLPVEDMKRLAACSDLVWVDHHQTAIDACHAAGVNPAGLREVFLAACELCWVHFKHGNDMSSIKEIPEAVSLLGIYDSWRKDDTYWREALAYQYAMRAQEGVYNPESDLWHPESAVWEKKTPFEMFRLGESILRYLAEVNQRACESGAWYDTFELPRGAASIPDPGGVNTYCGWDAVFCNTIVFNSTFFESVYDPEKHAIMVAYAQTKDGRWKVSLYSTKSTIDCGAIAKAFGGGGHKGAAGFECDKLPWEAQDD